VVIFGNLFGFLGVFLAVPLVIVSKIWLYELLIKDILNNWHKNEKDSSPPEEARKHLTFAKISNDKATVEIGASKL
jgi:hypothetical protein